MTYYDDDEFDARVDRFHDPYGTSALHAACCRPHPCPTCGEPERLSARDVASGYQCDECADRAEGRGD